MKQYLGFSMSALLVVLLLGFFPNFSTHSIARASIDALFSPEARLADSMRTTSLELDNKLFELIRLDSMSARRAFLAVESDASRTIAQRLHNIKNAISYTLPSIRPDIFRLGERISEQRHYIGELLTLVSQRRALHSSLPTLIPAAGTFTSPFGERIHPVTGARKMHTGIDIAAPTGTPIYAANTGTVVFAGIKGGYGNAVIVDHGFGYRTLYGHASELLVKEGDQVSQGQEIARIGSTGVSTGPHLHFEVFVDSARVDPLGFLSGELVLAKNTHTDHKHAGQTLAAK